MTQPKMKLLWIFSSFSVGPATRRFAALASGLGDKYEHLISSMDGDYEAEDMIPAGVAWRRLDAGKRRKRSLVSIGNLWSFRKVLTTERPHLVLTSNVGALEWLVVNRGPGAVPMVHFEDPAELAASLADDDPKSDWARRRAFPGRDRLFVAPCERIERKFVDSWGAAEEHVALIPMGVDLDAHAPGPSAPREDGALVLGAVGAITPKARLDRLARLVATLRERGRDVRARIYGDGPARDALETEIRTLGLEDRVTIHEPGDPAADLKTLDLYASVADEALSGDMVRRAMAAGLPIIGTDAGDARASVAAPNRVFIRDAEDESALTAAAELLAADDALRRELGVANRERAEARYGLADMVAKFDGLFRRMAVGALLQLPSPQAVASAEEDRRAAAPAPAPTAQAADAAQAPASAAPAQAGSGRKPKTGSKFKRPSAPRRTVGAPEPSAVVANGAGAANAAPGGDTAPAAAENSETAEHTGQSEAVRRLSEPSLSDAGPAGTPQAASKAGAGKAGGARAVDRHPLPRRRVGRFANGAQAS